MKNVLGILALVMTLFFGACGGASDKAADAAKDVAETTNAAMEDAGDAMATLVGDKYMVNTTDSKITWIGSKKIGGSSHNGTFALAEGALGVDKGSISGGSFTIDINSLTNLDMAGKDGAGKLEGHLKSADFFNAVEFPNATFSITKVTKVMNNDAMTHTVTGDLTLLGVSNSITMPATVSMEGDKLMASVKDFALNRTDWGMKYGSGLLGLAQDKIINDDVMIGIELVASK